MGSKDMNHLEHLEAVALADVNLLHMKEATYKGSWKAAGGRSAWFMARRNMDRLLTMMAPKPVAEYVNPQNVSDTLAAIRDWVHYGNKVTPLPGSIEATMRIIEALRDGFTAEDIFMKIRERPKGEDGTPLAVIRDLRRYLLLVEAEMVAEGEVDIEIQPIMYYTRPETDVYQMIADEQHLTREEVKQRIHELFYPVQGYAAHPVGVSEQTGEIVFPAVSPASIDPGPAVGDLLSEPPVTASGGYAAEQAARHGGEEQMHAKTPSLVPWQIDKGHYEALVIRVGVILAEAFYSRRASDVWQLEPVVNSATCPRELQNVMEFAKENRWIIKRAHVPAEIEENFPRLQLEKNTKEFEESDGNFKFMYAYDDSDQKWKLSPVFEAWGREVG